MDSTIVIKVKHEKTLRRFNARVLDNGLEFNLDGLRNKIRDLFNFSPDADLVLIYVDEDTDKITLGDDEDLRDVVRQRLNPLRIFVSLRADNVGRTTNESRTVGSSPVQNPFDNLHPAVIEFLNALPEPISKSLMSAMPEQPLSRGITKTLIDLASTGKLHEVIQFFKKNEFSSPRQPSESSATTDSSVQASAVSTEVALKLAGAKEAGSSNVRKSKPEVLSNEKQEKLLSKTGVTIVTGNPEAINEAKNQVTETREVVKSFVRPLGRKAEKERAISEENGSRWKVTRSSSVVGAPPIEVNDPSGKAKKKSLGFGSASMPNAIPLVKNDIFKKPVLQSVSKFMNGFQFPSAPGSETWNKGQPNTFNYPSSQCPFSGNYIGNNPASPYSRRNYGYSNGSGTIFHRGVSCDGCGVHPISGTRFKSRVMDDYDLCSICFAQIGVESDYVRIDRPMTYHNHNPSPLKGLYDLPPPGLYPPPPPPPPPPQQQSAFTSYGVNLNRLKLDSRFIQDVTILDGALMAPSTPFTKIWRMKNNGSLIWPKGTKLIWIGGDKLGNAFSVDLEIAGIGVPVDHELDVAADFIAPDHPGRYVSYWMMRSPNGQKFGQRVWVLIQVDQALPALQKALRDFNLNNKPSNPEVLDDEEPLEENAADLVKPGFDLSSEKKEDLMIFPTNDNLFVGGLTGQPSSSSVSSPPVSYPMIDIQRPCNGTFVAPPFNDDSDKTSEVDFVAEQINVVSYAGPVAKEETVIVDESEEEKLEKSLLMELDRMGFKEIDMNKQVLRSNKYDLLKSLNDLCGVVSEWDTILEELHEMGFHDDVMNKELLKKNKGSVTQVVLDLLVDEEDE